MSALMNRLIARFVEDESGADVIDYAFLAGLLSLACVLALSEIGSNVSGVLSRLGTR